MIMNIRGLIDKYRSSGCSLRDAQNLAAEEIILRKIAASQMADHITLKGGIVMHNLSQNNRRVTQDIDFDFIRYSVEEESIRALIRKMNAVNDGFSIEILGEIEKLHHEDYHGVRTRILILDSSHAKLRLKLDIGVHTYTAIDQDKLVFGFDTYGEGVMLKANPPEQICAEKLLSLSRLGTLSTRYKDLYDLYYLIRDRGISVQKTSEILKLFLDNSKRRPQDIFELQTSIEDTLNNNGFLAEVAKPTSRWMDIDIDDLRQTILAFVCGL